MQEACVLSQPVHKEKNKDLPWRNPQRVDSSVIWIQIRASLYKRPSLSQRKAGNCVRTLPGPDRLTDGECFTSELVWQEVNSGAHYFQLRPSWVLCKASSF